MLSETRVNLAISMASELSVSGAGWTLLSPGTEVGPGPRVHQACQEPPAQQPPPSLVGLPVLVHQVTDIGTFHFHPAVFLHVVHCERLRKDHGLNPLFSKSGVWHGRQQRLAGAFAPIPTPTQAENLFLPTPSPLSLPSLKIPFSQVSGGSTGLLLLTTPPE